VPRTFFNCDETTCRVDLKFMLFATYESLFYPGSWLELTEAQWRALPDAIALGID
jgi:hypothetical protein